MDERRMLELIEKARTAGLSDAEATELGRLYAEAKGAPYSSAAEEHAAQTAAAHATLLRQERGERRKRLPFGLFARRPYTTRSLEIGQTTSAPEDADRAA
jgi:hypothetical protein